MSKFPPLINTPSTCWSIVQSLFREANGGRIIGIPPTSWIARQYRWGKNRVGSCTESVPFAETPDKSAVMPTRGARLVLAWLIFVGRIDVCRFGGCAALV